MLDSFMMITSGQVWENIKSVFLNFNWTIMCAFLILVIMFYWVFKTLYENNAGRLIFLYVFMVVAGGIMALFHNGFIASGYFIDRKSVV